MMVSQAFIFLREVLLQDIAAMYDTVVHKESGRKLKDCAPWNKGASYCSHLLCNVYSRFGNLSVYVVNACHLEYYIMNNII